VPPGRLELPRPLRQQILSLPRLPVPPQGHRRAIILATAPTSMRQWRWRNGGRYATRAQDDPGAQYAVIRRLYDWTMKQAAGDKAPAVLAVVSFAESSVFPIPPDVLLIPMILAERARAWYFAFLCTTTSVLGALLGYAIGALLFDSVAQPILEFYGYATRFDDFAARYNEWGAGIVLIAGITPFPFKVITIASGATGLSLPIFITCAIIARGLRFFLVAGLLYWLGPPIRTFIERHLGLVFTAFIVALIGGFVLVKAYI
jgi:membrane protein YqaA with SNARE-associated domain